MGIVTAADLDAAAVIAAGRHGAIANDEARDGNAIFRIRFRIGNVHRLAPVAADDEVSADVDDQALCARCAERFFSGAPRNVAFHERIQRERRVAGMRRCPIGGVESPMDSANSGNGGIQFRLRRKALLRGSALPNSSDRLG